MTCPAPKHIEITGDIKPVWTQGIGPNGESDGSFEAREFALTLQEAGVLVCSMPPCKIVQDAERYCPPAFGFDRLNICRMETGKFYTWPDKLVLSTMLDALGWLTSNW